jgi:hypothetical protein
MTTWVEHLQVTHCLPTTRTCRHFATAFKPLIHCLHRVPVKGMVDHRVASSASATAQC